MTIKEVKEGMMFFNPRYIPPYNELNKVIAIVENLLAGQAIKDNYGNLNYFSIREVEAEME